MSKKGLYQKYVVTENPFGNEVLNCFVLEPEKDKAALRALETYALEIREKNPRLYLDLWNWIVGLVGSDTKLPMPKFDAKNERKVSS